MLDEYDKNVKAIKKDLLQICWYMRGGISYTEAHELSSDERSMIQDIIKSNLDITKETKLPFF